VKFLHEDEGYPAALDQVFRKLGIPRAQIEKDYFITHVLWALQASGLGLWFPSTFTTSSASIASASAR